MVGSVGFEGSWRGLVMDVGEQGRWEANEE